MTRAGLMNLVAQLAETTNLVETAQYAIDQAARAIPGSDAAGGKIPELKAQLDGYEETMQDLMIRLLSAVDTWGGAK